MESIIKRVMKKNKTYRLILLFISIVLSAIVYNIFLLPLSLVIGGSSGIATITYYVFEIDPALMVLLISVATALIGLMYLGYRKTIGSIAASILYPIMIQLTLPLSQLLNPNEVDVLLMVIFAGVLNGVANGLMYRTGYNMGGFSTISQILYEHKKVSVAKSTLFLNVIVVLLGTFFFGTTNALYAVIFLYINSLVMDKVLLGISNNKAFYIITDKDTEVKAYIIKTLGHDITTFEVKGGFLEKNRKVMLTVIPSREYYKVTEGIKAIDRDAFFLVTDSYQVEGGK